MFDSLRSLPSVLQSSQDSTLCATLSLALMCSRSCLKACLFWTMHTGGGLGHECHRIHGCHSGRGTSHDAADQPARAHQHLSHCIKALSIHGTVCDGLYTCPTLQVLLEAAKVWKREGIGLALAGPKPQVLHICERAGLLEVIGRHKNSILSACGASRYLSHHDVCSASTQRLMLQAAATSFGGFTTPSRRPASLELILTEPCTSFKEDDITTRIGSGYRDHIT